MLRLRLLRAHKDRQVGADGVFRCHFSSLCASITSDTSMDAIRLRDQLNTSHDRKWAQLDYLIMLETHCNLHSAEGQKCTNRAGGEGWRGRAKHAHILNLDPQWLPLI